MTDEREDLFKVSASLSSGEMHEFARMLDLSNPIHRNIWRKAIAPVEARHKVNFDLEIIDQPETPAVTEDGANG